MFVKFCVSFVFIALVLSGQKAGPSEGSAGACPAAQMGMVTDENFAVVDLAAGSPAQAAGVLPGDVLIDLTLLSIGEPFVCNDTPTLDETLPESRSVPPPRDVSIYPTEPVAFTEFEEINTLTDYGLTLRLRMLRAGQTVELTIEPGNVHRDVTPGAPTATAIPTTPTFYYF